jgi:TetR/AcrR family transcriptional regulator, transcriptional repressor for nem operon
MARTGTKDKILKLGEEYLQDRGFNGFSYKNLAEDLGIKPAAIHYHFPTKSELGVALISRLRDRFRRWSGRMAMESMGFWPRFEAYIEIHAGYLHNDGKVCPSGVIEVEYHVISEQMRSEAKSLVIEMQGWLAKTLDEGRDRGECVFVGTAADQAVSICATLQGALQIARICGPASFQVATAHLRRQLGDVNGV